MDKAEVLGVSDDLDVGATVGVCDGASICASNTNLNTSEGTSNARSGEKRKRSREKVRRGKMDSALIIEQQLERMTSVIESYTAAIVARNHDPCSTSIVMADLLNQTRVTEDRDLFVRCCSLMMNKAAREIYSALKDENAKFIWLTHAAYHPHP